MLATDDIPSAGHYLLFLIQVKNDLDWAPSTNVAEMIHAVMSMEFWLSEYVRLQQFKKYVM
jgi:hypothetical protein